jgi:hypothetical protein
MEGITPRDGEEEALYWIQLFHWRYLVLHQVFVTGSYHCNSDLLCEEWWEYQSTNNEHDTVECFFGDARQMVGGSTNKLTAAGFNRANKKASTFNAAKFSLVGNNSTGANMFGRNKKY